ncbi:MAG TPA: DNA/RNA non-specific endonuclease [Longimicrobiaceae bacterium]|nr:DNA/RNA non-specific endonuclease [Longimicrobiaceae bacterium]
MRTRSIGVAGAFSLVLALISCTDVSPVGPESRDAALLSTATVQRPQVVISQIYGGGGNSGATLRNDFIELFNPGTEPVSLEGWSVQYASASGTSWQFTALSDTIHPGGYYLVQQGAGAGGSVSLPTPDATGGIAMSATNGKVALVRSPGALPAGTCPSGPSVVDHVSFGTTATDCGFGTTGSLSNTTAALRNGDGCSYTQKLSADFSVGAPEPRNSSSRRTTCASSDTPLPPPSTPVVGDLVINEVLADPNAVLDSVGEWFEVYNRSASPVNLQGWQILSRNDAPHTINASVVVPAGGYAVLARNGDTSVNGGVAADYVYHTGDATLNLANSVDWLVLRDVTGAQVDSVAWNTTAPRGASRALLDPDSDNTSVDGDRWSTSLVVFGAGDRGTPGSDNNAPLPPPGEVASIFLSINAPAQVPAGYTKPAFPTARDAFGTIISPPPAYTWTSSDPSVARVDELGYITGVSVGTVTIRATAPNGVSGSAGFSVIAADAPTPAVYRNHLEFGIPTDGTPGDDHLMRKPQFALSYSTVRGGPNWVSWNINATHFGPEDRCNCFTADQSLPDAFYKVVDFDYRNGGYDRGHMVQSFTRTTTEQENAATFLLTNILPQAANNNQGPWGAFENYTNDVVRRQGKEAYVVAGGEYSANPQTLKGEGKVQVPEFTWKVVVFVAGGKGLADVKSLADLEVVAVRMPNDTAAARTIRNTPWETFKTTVDDIEARVGYDLLDRLPDAIERIVESGTRFPTARVDGPYTGVEGSPVSFDAGASTDPDGDALTYAWDFGDGSTGTGVAPTHSYADNGNYVVKVTVSDPYGASSTATTSVMVVNVAPTVAAFSGGTVIRGETFTSAGTFADPGADTWTATVDYGDGSGARPLALSGKAFSLSHAYSAAGTYTVTVTVTDDDGDASTRTASVTVQTPAQAVQRIMASVDGLVAAGDLTRGEGAALNATLDAARASADRDPVAAANQLGAFINQVEALRGSGRLSAAEAERLIAAARRVIRSIG